MSYVDRRRLSRAVIRQAIKDIGQGSNRQFECAKTFVCGSMLAAHARAAEYPELIVDIMAEMVLLSRVARMKTATEVLDALMAFEPKRKPPKKGA